MDYSEICDSIRQMMIAQGVDEKYLDKKETLYYDETGNVKHLIIKGDKLNADPDTVFVLGGVQAEDTISLNELKTALGKTTGKELKSKTDLKGSFSVLLSKDIFSKMLQLIQNKGWHIHFSIVQVLYYGFVDIVDSIDGLNADPFPFKAELYRVLKKDSNKTIALFMKYKYPNIAAKDIKDFLSEIIILIDGVITEDVERGYFNPLLFVLKNSFENATKQKELTFIQNETTHEWVGEFGQFYRQEILSFPKKTLVFDEEKQVMSMIAEENIIIDGISPKNYHFKESGDDSMIQISDYVVSILRKYMMFLDRIEPEVNADIHNFDEIQMNNFVLFNSVLADSLNYNPLFVHFIASQYTIAKYYKYMNMYGVTKAKK